MQAPIAYFNGHEAPDFTDAGKKVLRDYVEQGGFLFAEACCGRKAFDQGFRALMAELFPGEEQSFTPWPRITRSGGPSTCSTPTSTPSGGSSTAAAPW